MNKNLSHKKKHYLDVINQALPQLVEIHKRTAKPELLLHQYVGTIADSLAGLLDGAANSLIGNSRIVFSELRSWEIMSSLILRSFFSHMHSSIEQGFIEFYTTQQLSLPKSTRNQKIIKKILKIENEHAYDLSELRKFFKDSPPTFTDYLNGLLKESSLRKKRKEIWNNYFKALTIIRNKASHSNAILNENEITELNKGGFTPMISKNNTIEANPLYYVQVINFTLDFFDELLENFD